MTLQLLGEQTPQQVHLVWLHPLDEHGNVDVPDTTWADEQEAKRELFWIRGRREGVADDEIMTRWHQAETERIRQQMLNMGFVEEKGTEHGRHRPDDTT